MYNLLDVHNIYHNNSKIDIDCKLYVVNNIAIIIIIIHDLHT